MWLHEFGARTLPLCYLPKYSWADFIVEMFSKFGGKYLDSIKNYFISLFQFFKSFLILKVVNVGQNMLYHRLSNSNLELLNLWLYAHITV